MPKKRRNKRKKISSKNHDNNNNNEIKEKNNTDEIKEEKEEENTDEINTEKNEELNNDDDDEIKITNINYEKFIKENELLLNYIIKSNPSLIIHSDNFIEEINIKNKSLIKIIKQSGLDYEFKIFITLQIISENIELETLSRKSFSFNPKLVNYIKDKEKFNIKINEKEIQINKSNINKIFNLIGIYAFEEIINYIELTVTQIFFEYEKSQKLYTLKTAKNIKKCLQNNKIFYIKNDTNKNIKIPLTNYSLNKIFYLNNGGKDTKYLLINYKIKEEKENNDNNNEKENIYFNQLINISDVKNIYLKYNSEKENNTLKILSNNKKISKINEINIIDLNNYLNSSSDLLSNILSQINTKKSEILNLSENITNQFIKLKNSNNTNIFIPKKVIKELEQKSKEINNINSITILDYKKEKNNIELKYLENLDEDDIYIEIEFDKKKYLCRKNNVLRIYDSWIILNQIEMVDVIDIINDFSDSKINIVLLKLNIIQQNDNIDIKFNNDINIIKENKKEKMSLTEYINSLPKKKVYNIKYKVKIQRIAKNMTNN